MVASGIADSAARRPARLPTAWMNPADAAQSTIPVMPPGYAPDRRMRMDRGRMTWYGCRIPVMTAFTPIRPPLLFRAPPGWRWRTTTGAWWNCWCALDGRCTLRTGGRSFAIAAGSCLVLPPGTTVEADHDLRRPVVNLAIHGVFRDAQGRAGPPDPPPPLHAELADPLRLSRLAEDCLAAASGGVLGQEEYACLARALLARIRAAAAAGSPRPDRAIADLLLEVRRHPGQAWTVASCAARLGLSRSQLTRRFVDACGAAPATILARLRDEYALHLLRESDQTLAEVARLAGYVDASHLSRRLRRRTGTTPGRVR